jgi:hypothetical protein
LSLSANVRYTINALIYPIKLESKEMANCRQRRFATNGAATYTAAVRMLVPWFSSKSTRDHT